MHQLQANQKTYTQNESLKITQKNYEVHTSKSILKINTRLRKSKYKALYKNEQENRVCKWRKNAALYVILCYLTFTRIVYYDR